jgi:hypothetical protein
MKSFYEHFRDRIDGTDGTAVLTKPEYDAIVSEAADGRTVTDESCAMGHPYVRWVSQECPMTGCPLCSERARLVAVVDKECVDWEQWFIAVLTDFKIPFDNHKIGMRLALTQWMRDRL